MANPLCQEYKVITLLDTSENFVNLTFDSQLKPDYNLDMTVLPIRIAQQLWLVNMFQPIPIQESI